VAQQKEDGAQLVVQQRKEMVRQMEDVAFHSPFHLALSPWHVLASSQGYCGYEAW
jgi:hypothetical protein